MRRSSSPSTADVSGVDDRHPTPLYHQIFLVLRDKIVNGSYPRDTAVPSEQEVCKSFGVSRITAKRALDELAAAGLVVRQRGRGTRVVYQAPSAPIQSSVEGMLENLLAMGLQTDIEVLEFGYLPATTDVAGHLDCETGAVVQHTVRVRLIDGKPFSYLTTFVPADIGQSYTRDDLASTPLLMLLERCDVVVSSAEQIITAVLADTTVAPVLQLEVGAPLLRITRIVRDQDGRPVEYITGLYRPDRYQFRMKLTRVEGEDAKTWSSEPHVITTGPQSE